MCALAELPGRLALLLAGAVLSTSAVPAAAAGRTYTVEIRNMAFGPLPSKLHRGDTIQWINADIFRHTATATNKSFDVDLPPKARAQTRLKTSGTISFYCRFHPGMKGVLKVAP